MQTNILRLNAILGSPSQYVVPVFQRNYRWNAPQWSKLWDNLQEIREPARTGNHFMGFLVLVPGVPLPGQPTTYHLVDGQQRLTTLSLVLAAIRNLARDAHFPALADEVHENYLIHRFHKGDQRYRLLPKDRDKGRYVSIVDGVTKPEGPLGDAVRFFEVKLSDLVGGHEDGLRSFFNTVCQRLEFIYAILEAENAYSIFKSLNSTGVPLGPSDLIRNFVFMHLPPESQDEFDRQHWSPLESEFARADGTLDEERFARFFRDFLMSSSSSTGPSARYVTPPDTFPAFEARYEATSLSPFALAETLRAASRHFSAIAGRRPDLDGEVAQALALLNAVDSSTTYPLLLWLFDARAKGQIDSRGLAQAINMLYGFIVRRFICGESSRGYGPMFVRAIAHDARDPIQALKTYLLERGWPDERRFEDAFVRCPLYKSAYAKHVLETLERSSGHKEPVDLGGATVEHIMPQTLNYEWRAALGADAERIHAAWLHRPGNLTLSAYNPELRDSPFATKRSIYGQSHIGLTRELATYESWGEVEIVRRGKRLAEMASEIWTGPKGPYAAPALPAPTEEICKLADQNGIGGAFRALLAAAGRHGLYARPSPSSRIYVMCTSPRNRTRALLVPCARPPGAGLLKLWVASKAFADYYPVTVQQSVERLGEEGNRDLSADQMGEFIAALDGLFDLIHAAERGPAVVSVQPGNASEPAQDGGGGMS